MIKRPSETASESETLIGFSDIRTLDATDENGRIGQFRTIRTVHRCGVIRASARDRARQGRAPLAADLGRPIDDGLPSDAALAAMLAEAAGYEPVRNTAAGERLGQRDIERSTIVADDGRRVPVRETAEAPTNVRSARGSRAPNDPFSAVRAPIPTPLRIRARGERSELRRRVRQIIRRIRRMTTERDEPAGGDRCATCGQPSDGRLLCDACRGYTVGTPHPSTTPPERLETRAHLCGVIDEQGLPCRVLTLRARCLRHRWQRAAHWPEGEP